MIPEPTDPAARIIDGLGREWAQKTNGAWACLGDALSVDTYADLVETYGIGEVLP